MQDIQRSIGYETDNAVCPVAVISEVLNNDIEETRYP